MDHQTQGPSLNLSAGTPDNPAAAAAEIDALSATLGAEPASTPAPAPSVSRAPETTAAPASAFQYGDEYPAGEHVIAGRTLRKHSNGAWSDPERKAFVANPLPRPKRRPGRPRKPAAAAPAAEPLTGPIMGEPLRRSIGGEAAQLKAENDQLRVQLEEIRAQLRAQRSVENKDKIHTALAMTFSLAGSLMAKARGPHCAIDEAEAETLADGWTPVVMELLPEDLHGDSIWLPAIVSTVLVVGPKLKADQDAQRAAQQGKPALESGAAA